MGMELWPPWLTPRPFLKLLHVKDMHKEECEQNQKTMNHELKCIYQIPKNPTSFQKEKQSTWKENAHEFANLLCFPYLVAFSIKIKPPSIN